jgi:hypothetical protein
LLAPRGLANILGQPWYLNTSGVVQFAGTQVIPKSVALDGLMSISKYRVQIDSDNYITSEQYAKSFMAMHDKKLFLFAPRAYKTDTVDYRSNVQAYVWDTRYSGWVAFSAPSVMTGGLSVDTTNDRSILYVGGYDGQIYVLNNFYDSPYRYKPTSGSGTSTLSFSGTTNTTGLTVNDPVTIVKAGGGLTVDTTMYVKTVTNNSVQLSASISGTAYAFTGGTVPEFCLLGEIDWEVFTRAFGQAYSDGVAYYSKNRPSQIDLHAIGDTSGGSTVSWVVQNEVGVQTTGDYTITGNASRAIRGLNRDVIGVNFQIGLSGTELDYPFRLYAVHIHMVESGIQRHR